MTREEQQKLRELKKALSCLLKEKVKIYKLKKKDDTVWCKRGDLFFEMSFYVGAWQDRACSCHVSAHMKPLWLDNLLWDLLQMDNNKDESLSLRAVGAFTVFGSQLFEECQELQNWEVFELKKCVDGYLQQFCQSVQSVTEDDFLEKIETPLYHGELRKALTLIHEEKYPETLDYLDGKGRGCFCNGDVWIYDAMRDYCKRKVLYSFD